MSKAFIALSLLLLLLSACDRPYVGPTPSMEPIQFARPMGTATPTALFDTSTQTPSVVTATAVSVCPAPAPHIKIGQQVTVTVENWDKLKLRAKPEISPDTVLLELDQYSRLEILAGPECVSSAETGASYWFWKVKVLPSGKVGWIAEGDHSHYYIENVHG